MGTDASTTLYFAVGYFTATELEDQHRDMLTRALRDPSPVPPIRPALLSVHVTIFKVDTGTETVELDIKPVLVRPSELPAPASDARFILEKFDPATFPLDQQTPEDAFVHYLKTPDGLNTFGKARGVQLFSIDIHHGQ